MKEGVAVRRMRSAVDLEDERPLPRWIETDWFHEPALDRPAIGALEFDALRRGDVFGSEELVVEAARLAHRTSDFADEEIAGVGRRRDDGGEAAFRPFQRPRDNLMASNGLGADIAAARGARVRVRRSLIGAEKEDAAIARPRGWQRLRVRAHIADHRRAHRAVPSGEQIGAGPASLWESPDVNVAGRGSDRAVG